MFLCLAWIVSSGAGAQTLRPYRAAIHVHSTFSSGDLSVEELAKRAEEEGLDILVLTDQALASLAWGVYPLRNLLRVQAEGRSVFRLGAREYLAAAAEASRRHPNLLLVPGIEAAAHYHFSGDLFRGDLVAHNWHRHLLVLGLSRPEDFLALPVAGGPTLDLLRERGASALPATVWAYLLPGAGFLVVLIGVVLMFRRGYRRALGFLAFLAFLPLTVNALPFLKPPSDPYRGDPGIQPYQAFIDAAVRLGGIALWAHPGSVPREQKLGPFALETPPHLEVLLQSRGYTAFNAISGNGLVSGRQWDLVLGDYVRGRRESPVWAFGGMDVHSLRELQRPAKLSDVQTVFLLKDRTEAEVLSALLKGRMYVLRGRGPSRLRLDEFSVVSKDRGLMALSGETVPSDHPPEIRFRISTQDDSPADLTVRLIRNGEVVQTFRGNPPLQAQYTDRGPPPPGKVYYRLDAEAPPTGRLITNPIFVSRP